MYRHEIVEVGGTPMPVFVFDAPERYRDAQSEDAWAKAIDFFGRHLRP